MISREQFEALVRAEAERRWPMPDDEPDFTSLDRQTAYIAARMEHEWPLVDVLRRIIDLDIAYGERPSHSDTILALHHIRKTAIAALSPYTTKPIER